MSACSVEEALFLRTFFLARQKKVTPPPAGLAWACHQRNFQRAASFVSASVVQPPNGATWPLPLTCLIASSPAPDGYQLPCVAADWSLLRVVHLGPFQHLPRDARRRAC